LGLSIAERDRVRLRAKTRTTPSPSRERKPERPDASAPNLAVSRSPAENGYLCGSELLSRCGGVHGACTQRSAGGSRDPGLDVTRWWLGDPLGGLHDENRAGRLVGNGVRNAAEHATAHALVPDHEHIGAALLGEAHEHVGGIALVEQDRAFNALARDLVRRSGDDLPHSRRWAVGPIQLDGIPLMSSATGVAESAEQHDLRLEAARELHGYRYSLAGGC
jgi:hypothetical protein